MAFPSGSRSRRGVRYDPIILVGAARQRFSRAGSSHEIQEDRHQAQRAGDRRRGRLRVQRGSPTHLATEVIEVRKLGVEIAIVVGGGNVFRGSRSDAWGIDRVEADNIGMMATVINSLLLRGKLNAMGERDVRVMTAIPIDRVAEPFIRLRAVHHLEKGAMLILACGIGQPFLTTDYPSVQRALELGADGLLVAKHGVDGVYDSDPCVDPGARRFERLTYDEVLDSRSG
ncbi:uridine monophosphate kinase [Streptosporangium lutulentum]